MDTLAYFPLESYKSRYTELMSCPDGWTETAFKPHFKLVPFRPETDVAIIRKGEVLDSFNRPVYAMKQVIEYLNRGERLPIFVEDFFHPGIEAVKYAHRADVPMFAFCWAQTFDRYDFTRTEEHIRSWMRIWETLGLHLYQKVFVASEVLLDLIGSAFPELVDMGAVQYVGLPFNSVAVKKVRGESTLGSVQPIDAIFTSRLDMEKNFLFFCQLADKLGGKYRFAVSTGFDEMRGTDKEGIELAKKLIDNGKLVVYTGMTKPDYYSLLSQSTVQFNSSYQDWVSFTLLEALTFGCTPCYPRHRDFVDVFSHAPQYLYTPRSLPNAAEVLTAHMQAGRVRANLTPELKSILDWHNGTYDRMTATIGAHLRFS